jgi:hypothetical protein
MSERPECDLGISFAYDMQMCSNDLRLGLCTKVPKLMRLPCRVVVLARLPVFEATPQIATPLSLFAQRYAGFYSTKMHM